MFLEKLTIVQFRNFCSLVLSDFSQINFLIGDNGSGKTNFLEAIYLLSSGKGFRTNDRKEFFFHESSELSIKGIFDGELVELDISEKRKTLFINTETIAVNKLRTYNPVVSFSSTDILLTLGTPEIRRRFFDAAIALLDSTYEKHLSVFERCLRQRNAALKKDPEHINLWNESMIQHGAQIIEKRIAFAQHLIPRVKTIYNSVTRGVADLKYFNNFRLDDNIENSLSNAISESFTEDIYRKSTSKGPHRDDIVITIDGLPTNKSASLGQNRILSFAMKIAAVEIIEEMLERKPILLIDDALLELDPSKKSLIFNKLVSLNLQMFVSGTSHRFFDFELKNPARTLDFPIAP